MSTDVVLEKSKAVFQMGEKSIPCFVDQLLLDREYGGFPRVLVKTKFYGTIIFNSDMIAEISKLSVFKGELEVQFEETEEVVKLVGVKWVVRSSTASQREETGLDSLNLVVEVRQVA